MNIYKLISLNRIITNHRIKFFGIYLLHKLNKRYLAVNIDPVLACNLRCKMCYFTDEDYVKNNKGQFLLKDLKLVADRIFDRALKLQIGCGTEPTLYKNLPELVRLGKAHHVPYISLTTNANLLNHDKIEELLDAGLNEFTISLHGVTKDSYEGFMQNASYEKFMDVFQILKRLKKEREFKVRINYTFNKDNFYELSTFFEHFDGDSFDILQIRPIQNLGNTDYQDFDITSLIDDYPKLISNIRKECRKFGITLMVPNKLETLKQTNKSSYIFDYTFCYISPNKFWKDGFDWRNETFNQFSERINWSHSLLKNVFKSNEQMSSTSKRLNYEIEFN
ncbi:Radical SAM superfamily protein [Flavobacteriaceae bacterium MAR_2010_188]|nr:Radical SAM superfamily protein [Flavobacteriaceae bacterium MAR_2010_188]